MGDGGGRVARALLLNCNGISRKLTIVEKRTVFFTMVMHPATGWTRVGNAYPSRKAAADWLPFVRGAWRGLRVKVSQCTVRLEGGKVCEQSRRLLDEKYNLDA